jgi:hypothetical protein
MVSGLDNIKRLVLFTKFTGILRNKNIFKTRVSKLSLITDPYTC